MQGTAVFFVPTPVRVRLAHDDVALVDETLHDKPDVEQLVVRIAHADGHVLQIDEDRDVSGVVRLRYHSSLSLGELEIRV